MTEITQWWRAAIDAWRDVVGAAHVETDPESLARAETATFATSQRVIAVVRPASSAEVQEVVRIANRFSTPVYPVSRGKNWGYGSRVPVRTEHALLSLERMDRIVELDEELGTITIEPGVTFLQAHAFLRERSSRWMMSGIGADPGVSVIGNVLERGVGAGPCGDRPHHATELEVVLPEGEVVRTGFGQFRDVPIARLNRWGLGPALDGLFYQSNLGVVTRLTLGLARRPLHFGRFFARIWDADRLGPFVDGLRELRALRVLEGPTLVTNDYRVLPVFMQYPWEAMGSATPLPPETACELATGFGMGMWTSHGGLFCATRAHLRASVHAVRRVLGDVVESLDFFDASRLRRARLLRAPMRWLGKDDPYEAARKALDPDQPLLGGPSRGTLRSAYWRKRIPVPDDPDPDRDRCGLVWCSPCIPFTGRDAVRCMSIVREVVLDAGFEPGMTLNAVSDRYINVVSSIVYDRDADGQDDRASRCHETLLCRLDAAGYLPYRLGIQSMERLAGSRTPPYRRALDAVGRALDPRGILAQGRYG